MTRNVEHEVPRDGDAAAIATAIAGEPDVAEATPRFVTVLATGDSRSVASLHETRVAAESHADEHAREHDDDPAVRTSIRGLVIIRRHTTNRKHRTP